MRLNEDAMEEEQRGTKMTFIAEHQVRLVLITKAS